MTPDQVLTVVVNDVRAWVREAADERARAITSGPGRVDPLTGEPAAAASEATRRMAQLLAARGLNEDEQLVDALRALLVDAAAEPMFHLFAALDGAAEFSRDVKLEVRMVNGQRLPTYVHEVLGPIDAVRE